MFPHIDKFHGKGCFSAPGTKGCNRDDPKLNECVVKTANAILPGIMKGE